MAERQLTVDDIMAELELKRAKDQQRVPKQQDMGRIDEIVREILTQKKERELKQENRPMTSREKAELEKEIRVQTKTLTRQLAKQQKKRAKQDRQEEKWLDTVLTRETQPVQPKPEPVQPEPEIRLNRVQKEQQVKRHPSPRSAEVEEERVLARKLKLEKLSNTAHGQRLRNQVMDITSHFGNVRMEDSSVEAGYAKTQITPVNYKEYKSSRNRKIDSFVLNAERRPPSTEELPPELREQLTEGKGMRFSSAPDGLGERVSEASPQRDSGRRFRDEEEEYQPEPAIEYTDRSMTEEITEYLGQQRAAVRTGLVLTCLESVFAILLSVLKRENGRLFLFGSMEISPQVYAVVNACLLVLALASGFLMVKNAFASIARRQPSKDVLCMVTVLFCLGMNLALCFQPENLLTRNVHLYTPAAVLLIFFNYLGRGLNIKRVSDNFALVSGEQEQYGVLGVPNMDIAAEMTARMLDNDEDPCLMRNVKTGFFDNFLLYSFGPDLGDNMSRTVLLLLIPAGFALGAAGYGLTKDIYVALTLLCGTLVLSTGFLSSLVTAFPLRDSASVTRRYNGVLVGYDAVEQTRDANAVLIDAVDLFPPQGIVLYGIKTFQAGRIDDAILDAASVCCTANSIFRHIFLGIINNNTALLKKVDSVQYEDQMGLSAWVDDKRVLIGNRALMINHSIAVPKQNYERKYQNSGQEVIYLSSGGDLCAAFIVGFQADPSVMDVVGLLARNNLVAVVRTMDSCVSEMLLAELFQTDPRLFNVLPSRLHPDYDSLVREVLRCNTPIGNDGSLFGYIVSLCTAKKLFGCVRLGGLLYVLSVIIGVALLGVLFAAGRLSGFGSLALLIYLAVFPLIYWIYQKNMRL